MAMTISTVYSFDMPKYVYVQLFAQQGGTVPPTLRIRADKIEKKESGGGMVLKIGNELVGELNAPPAGWWIQDEEK